MFYVENKFKRLKYIIFFIFLFFIIFCITYFFKKRNNNKKLNNVRINKSNSKNIFISYFKRMIKTKLVKFTKISSFFNKFNTIYTGFLMGFSSVLVFLFIIKYKLLSFFNKYYNLGVFPLTNSSNVNTINIIPSKFSNTLTLSQINLFFKSKLFFIIILFIFVIITFLLVTFFVIGNKFFSKIQNKSEVECITHGISTET